MEGNIATHVASLDSFYFSEIVPTFPPMLGELIINERVLRGSNLHGQVQSLSQVFSAEDIALPWLLKKIFPVDEETLMEIAKAHLLMFVSCVLLDHLVDAQIPNASLVLLAQQILMQRFLKQMRLISGQYDPYLDRVCQHLEAYHAVLAQESHCLSSDYNHVDKEVFETIYTGKTVLCAITIEALGFASGKTEPIEPVLAALRHIGTAYQLFDDLNDWWEDYLRMRFTLPLRLALTFPYSKSVLQSELRFKLDQKGIIATLLSKVDWNLNEAEKAIKVILPADEALRSYIRKLRIITQRRLRRACSSHVLASLLNGTHP